MDSWLCLGDRSLDIRYPGGSCDDHRQGSSRRPNPGSSAPDPRASVDCHRHRRCTVFQWPAAVLSRGPLSLSANFLYLIFFGGPDALIAPVVLLLVPASVFFGWLMSPVLHGSLSI